ncbi:MAG TPA: F0F1 ATP synthase subunit delta, partial [Candidatus Dormibacteraeota bacterium]|nr:F0F1 ATP synthase subunit delta [Candidatus Dormibacteraeota bacterium]
MATAAAKRYAKAVFELASADGDFEQWSRRLAKIRELFDDPKVAAVLSNPTISSEQRESLVATSPHLFDQEATNLGRLLIEAGRIA